MEENNNTIDFEEVVLKIPKNSCALVITSVYIQDKGFSMNTSTYDTNQIKELARYNKEREEK